MSKVLIDRAVLEATLEHAEFVSGAACEADDAIRAVLAAPISTPELPIKAYYHERTDLEGVRTRSVGLEVRKEFTDAPLVLESDALATIGGLRAEVGAQRVKTCAALKARNDAHEERDRQAQRIGELEGLLRNAFPRIDITKPVPLDEKAHCCEYTIYVERERLHKLIDAALSAGKEGE